jgi:soluble lytic murein transglycosylase
MISWKSTPNLNHLPRLKQRPKIKMPLRRLSRTLTLWLALTGICLPASTYAAGPQPHDISPSAGATANSPEAAKVTAKNSEEHRLAEALTPLNEADAERYRKIFELQKSGRWQEADKLVRQLDNRILVGYVLADRYLHQPGYRVTYNELARWMSLYADLPEASTIYKIAAAHRPRHKKSEPLLPPVPLTRPALVVQKPEPPTIVGDDEALPVAPSINIKQRREIYRLKTAIYDYLHHSDPQQAESQLMAPYAKSLFSKTEFARTLASVANSYFRNGFDRKALALASISAPALRGLSPLADWIAGLAAWKLGDFDESAKHFEQVAHDNSASRWQLSAGAFWAARARLANHQPEQVNDLLRLAAAQPRTFYGLLAARQLGHQIDVSWDLPPLSYSQLKPMLDIQGVKRTMALAQVGRREAADQELKIVWQRYMPDIHEALLGLAARLNLPTTQVKVARTLADQATWPIDSALYPLPDWQPRGGYSIDRSLLLAFMRQESEFNPKAKSVVGALGLMQLMPNTASLVGKDQSLRTDNGVRLYEADYNMLLGQRYISRLLDKDVTAGNLFLVVAGYNAGPGNASRWFAKNNFQNDPLLFIESIPMEETRDFVVRVMSNMWLYQMRTGHSTGSLDEVAAGRWPMYEGASKAGQSGDNSSQPNIQPPNAPQTAQPPNVQPPNAQRELNARN